jgi:hypothetical protein
MTQLIYTSPTPIKSRVYNIKTFRDRDVAPSKKGGRANV